MPFGQANSRSHADDECANAAGLAMATIEHSKPQLAHIGRCYKPLVFGDARLPGSVGACQQLGSDSSVASLRIA